MRTPDWTSVLLNELLLAEISSFLRRPYALDATCRAIQQLRFLRGLYRIPLFAVYKRRSAEWLGRRVSNAKRQLIVRFEDSESLCNDFTRRILLDAYQVRAKSVKRCMIDSLISLNNVTTATIVSDALYHPNIHQFLQKLERVYFIFSDSEGRSALDNFEFPCLQRCVQLAICDPFCSGLNPSIRNLSNLRELSIFRIKHIENLKPLEDLHNLVKLRITASVDDMSGLKKLKRLHTLQLGAYIKPSNIRFVAKLKNLISLIFSDCVVKDLQFIENFKRLRFFDSYKLKVNSGIFQPISTLLNISELHLVSTIVRDLVWIVSLMSLTRLRLGLIEALQDFSPIGKLENLEILEIQSRYCIQLSDSLRNLTKLKTFHVQSVGNPDMSVIKHLCSLENLHIWISGVFDCSLVAEIKTLRRLVIRGKAINVKSIHCRIVETEIGGKRITKKGKVYI